MAVNQINFYSNSDVSIIDLMNTADASFIGTHTVSLTNYDNTSLPAIAIGSIVENNGALFKFTSETAITGSPSNGTVYIRLIPSGDPALGTATVTPTWTNTAPTWSDSKQGWYGTGGSANYRYLFVMTKATTSYSKKRFLDYNYKVDQLYVETLTIGNALAPVNRYTSSMNGNYTFDVIFDTISPYVPNINDKIKICGGGITSRVYSYAERTSSTEITFYYWNTAGSAGTMVVDNGNTSVNHTWTISW